MDKSKNYWPVPAGYSKHLPINGEDGSFWQDRGDRHHAGVDIYAPPQSKVILPEDGIVLDVEIFTSPKIRQYWHLTYSIFVKSISGYFLRMAELEQPTCKQGDELIAGSLIGLVGCVLNSAEISHHSPIYIQELSERGRFSMLHFELHSCFPPDITNYLGGNYYQDFPPATLLDPTQYLTNCTRDYE